VAMSRDWWLTFGLGGDVRRKHTDNTQHIAVLQHRIVGLSFGIVARYVLNIPDVL
jgi:hypothetical protein